MHAEVVRVEFDPAVVTYAELLDVFFERHDPTTLNRQGNDVGTQYRSAVFFHSTAQRESAFAASTRVSSDLGFPVVTEVLDAAEHPFWAAEGYHQRYGRAPAPRLRDRQGAVVLERDAAPVTLLLCLPPRLMVDVFTYARTHLPTPRSRRYLQKHGQNANKGAREFIRCYG